MDDAMKKRLRKALALSAGIAAAAVLLLCLKPPCLIKMITGFRCPGCGTQRMLWALFKGDFGRAFKYNPFMFLALPAFGIAYITESIRFILGKAPLIHKKGTIAALAAVLAIAIVFAVFRNIFEF